MSVQTFSNLIGHNYTTYGSSYDGDFLFIQMRSLHLKAMREIIIEKVDEYRYNMVAPNGVQQANGHKRSSATLAVFPSLQAMTGFCAQDLAVESLRDETIWSH